MIHSASPQSIRLRNVMSDQISISSGSVSASIEGDGHSLGAPSSRLSAGELAPLTPEREIIASQEGWQSHVPGGAFELKFLLSSTQTATIVEWAKSHLSPDPHSTAEIGAGYRVNSVYLDTAGLDIFHRHEGFRKKKYRLRRYNDSSVVWLEIKEKRDGRVYKRRSPVSDTEFLSASAIEDGGEHAWFHSVLIDRKLQPACQVTYLRQAWVGNSAHGPVRLTLDADLASARPDGWSVPDRPLPATNLLGDRQILELKFRSTLPTEYRTLIQDLQLTVDSFSKYRSSVAATQPHLAAVIEGGSTPPHA